MKDLCNLRIIATCIVVFAIGSLLLIPSSTTDHLTPPSTEITGIPIVDIPLPEIRGQSPRPKRNKTMWPYLQCSVRIHVIKEGRKGIGSGTICYYDEATGEAYVISCGHLFVGKKQPGGRGIKWATLDVFYKNDYKLSKPQRYKAKVICYDSARDISILRFKPDWVVQSYFPIAPLNYPIRPGDRFESTGCDMGTPTAAYTVSIFRTGTKNGLISKDNSPRLGRSGGGLLSPDGYYLGIVWATSDKDGTGYGFYVPLQRIHAYIAQYNQIKWLLKGGQQWHIINTIPLLDENGRIIDKPDRFIPLPTTLPLFLPPTSGQHIAGIVSTSSPSLNRRRTRKPFRPFQDTRKQRSRGNQDQKALRPVIPHQSR